MQHHAELALGPKMPALSLTDCDARTSLTHSIPPWSLEALTSRHGACCTHGGLHAGRAGCFDLKTRWLPRIPFDVGRIDNANTALLQAAVALRCCHYSATDTTALVNHICMYIYTYMHVYKYMQNTGTYICIYNYTYTYTYTYTYIYIYIYIYICVHTSLYARTVAIQTFSG